MEKDCTGLIVSTTNRLVQMPVRTYSVSQLFLFGSDNDIVSKKGREFLPIISFFWKEDVGNPIHGPNVQR